ncbi:MAG: hypothetical protein KIT09_29240 [Bryobacteraceae bacterium]|nr:hypothetical protein [Bryobacteraceae bacterium]
MLRIAKIFIFPSTLALLALAPWAQQPAAAAVEPLSSPAYKCWTSGSGATYIQICISKHGNVVLLKAPTPTGAIDEGYVACLKTPAGAAASYYDAGSTQSGWAEPYKVTDAPVIYRKTTDGKLELTQSFSRDAEKRDFLITMTLYNRSGKTLYDVRLDRYFGLKDDPNVFNLSPRAVFAWDEPAFSKFVTMTELTATSYDTAVHTSGGWIKNACHQTTEPTPTAPGNWAGRISHNFGTMAAGASKTIKVLYRLQ